jgi:hypothetical protein
LSRKRGVESARQRGKERRICGSCIVYWQIFQPWKCKQPWRLARLPLLPSAGLQKAKAPTHPWTWSLAFVGDLTLPLTSLLDFRLYANDHQQSLGRSFSFSPTDVSK